MTRIEPQETHHAEGLFQALSDPRIYDFLDEGPPASRDWLLNRIEKLKSGGPPDRSERWLNWVVIHDGVIVGYTQATVAADGTATVAFVLCSQAWGRSIAYRACRSMLRALWNDPAVTRIVADTEAGNVRSQRLLARLGFRQTGRQGKDLFFALGRHG